MERESMGVRMGCGKGYGEITIWCNVLKKIVFNPKILENGVSVNLARISVSNFPMMHTLKTVSLNSIDVDDY